jgi:hypothetical protein
MHLTDDGSDRCPLCGSPTLVVTPTDPATLRALILRARQRLDDLECLAEPRHRAEKPAAAHEPQLQERIDRGLQQLEGGFGTEDRPWR